jgi:predicted  nucleic acid-binding Zn-ribbon protein
MSNKEEAKQKVEQIDEQVRSTVHNVANKVNGQIENLDIDGAAKKAEDEINKLKSELADIKRRAGPKIQEAENFLTSPTAITFYKGLITGVAIVLTYKKLYESKY